MPAEEPVPTWRRKRYGRCRICQKFGRLTREHVPPASAFNEGGYRQFYVEQTEEAELRQWKSRDVNANGIYVFSLCETCNNKTGGVYGAAYADFVQSFSAVATFDNADKEVEVEIENLYPARVVKQAVSMILSTSTPESFGRHTPVWNPFLRTSPLPTSMEGLGTPPDLQHLRGVYDDLRRFVSKRTAKGLPSSVRLYAYAVANSGSGVRTGILGTANLSTRKALWGVVVGLWPIHWLLTFEGEPEDQFLEVTDWANESFKVKRKLKVRIPCRWTVAKYPLDFRTPEKFMRDGFVSKMRYEGYIPDPGADEEKMFAEAIGFARRRGTRTADGIFVKQFKTGTYAEFRGRMLWFEGRRLKEVRESLKERLARERAQEREAKKSGSDAE